MLMSMTLTQIVASFIHAIKSGQSIVYIEGQRLYNFKNVFLSLKINFAIANSADPDECCTICGISSGSSLFA